ncbi:MAG: ATP-binding cassette domain-containing protein [Acidobacteria bacterium]|nr:ATP-binding cassette domain-containing protein [Acidobacteriota bacterium]
MSSPAVAFRSVSKSYPIYQNPADRLKEILTFHRLKRHQDHWALRDVSFEVGRGEVFCLVGENGSGKSTSLQLAAQIFPPSAGQVEINGRVSALLELGAGFNPEFSGRDNVFLSGTVLGLSTAEITRRYEAIEQFAEIGDFINQPVKTYSSGMLVRLAFAVAINVEPEVLLVDEALAVGDFYFRQRCMRQVHELRKRGVTILFVSHAMADVKALGTQCLWLENGRMVELGPPDRVVSKYLARMTEKDAAYLDRRGSAAAPPRASVIAPEVVERIPNIDHRHGDGGAEILGVAALDASGRELAMLEPHAPLTLRISVRAKRALEAPNVGFMLRNHMGIDFAGSNTAREGVELPPMQPGDITTVDFHLDLPELYPGNFSFSPAVADGDEISYVMCDWIDNALALPMAHRGKQIYGYIHLPCRIAVNRRLAESVLVPE